MPRELRAPPSLTASSPGALLKRRRRSGGRGQASGRANNDNKKGALSGSARGFAAVPAACALPCERRYKMRELYHQGIVKPTLVPPAEMSADLLTKALDDKTFHKRR